MIKYLIFLYGTKDTQGRRNNLIIIKSQNPFSVNINEIIVTIMMIGPCKNDEAALSLAPGDTFLTM